MTAATGKTPATHPGRSHWKLIAALVALGIAGVIAANAHLVYVSVMSQPECVPHSKEHATNGAGTVYLAARSSC